MFKKMYDLHVSLCSDDSKLVLLQCGKQLQLVNAILYSYMYLLVSTNVLLFVVQINSFTPLHDASHLGHYEAVEILVKNGSQVDIRAEVSLKMS